MDQKWCPSEGKLQKLGKSEFIINLPNIWVEMDPNKDI